MSVPAISKKAFLPTLLDETIKKLKFLKLHVSKFATQNLYVEPEIRHSDDKVEIEKIDGSKVTADRCVVTVPLALLKKNCISFSPGLSERKRDAIARLGAGLIEKILLRYDTKWWSYKIGGADFFGSIEMTGSDSGVDAEDEQDWIFHYHGRTINSKDWLVLIK